MKTLIRNIIIKKWFVLLLYCSAVTSICHAQANSGEKLKKASKKVEIGIDRNNKDTLAQGYFDLGESYYQKGELQKSETFYKKAKEQFEKIPDEDGIARSSRALAKVQEDLHKNKDAVINYEIAQKSNYARGDSNAVTLNTNDIERLSKPLYFTNGLQSQYLQQNINLGIVNKDTNEILSNYFRLAGNSLINKNNTEALNALKSGYQFSVNNTSQALKFSQGITDVYLKEKNYPKAIESKKALLNEDFVKNSTEIKAREMISLADIYLQKKEDSTAVRLFRESYELSVKNGHTMEAKKNIEKLDSIYQKNGKAAYSLVLYKNFLTALPDIIAKDSSLIDEMIVAETESKIRKLETEKALKDDLINRKNIFNYWLLGSIVVLLGFVGSVLVMLKKLQVKNKKIALQSLRREMNPHFIFNSLNSINQFIANNNELEANQYLTKFSTLMRRVMENSKEDFVLFSKEIELLKNYLELEKSRFPEKFDFKIQVDDALYEDEQLYIPGMLVQPHLENAIWHGLRYIDDKGLLILNFSISNNGIAITIEDNGIGIAESKKVKTPNQKKHVGRGIVNTQERIKILNELYHHNISCQVEDKPGANTGVIVKITTPLLKNIKHEN